ncbi:MAG: hypothetical protein JOS17DRAFT_123262 [Linnemannia elongata]|nr:MAG: hypothetical protein JOS17DRAFT_123262 [Linnemannia elongata]
MPSPKWKTEIVPSHKFEFINIADFHSNSPWARIRYMWVWIMFFKAILVLCGDIWTCTILIISGAWTSEIKPAIEVSIARWIFTGCILLSFLLLATEFRKANRVMKSQDISYAVSNTIVSGFYCLQKFDYFCFIEKIRNSSKLHDKLSFFVFFQLKGWKHLVVQAPRAVISIMILVAFMRALDFDFDHLDEVSQILPSLNLAYKFTFCVMVFTSLMFILSGLATLIAIILWIPLVAKVQGNLKEYVCHKMDKRIDNIIKKTTMERAKRTRREQELEDKRYNESLGHEGSGGNGGNGGGGESGASAGSGGFRKDGRPFSAMTPTFGGSTPRRPKPTLPDIDVILANAHEDIRLPSKARTSKQQQRPQHIDQHPYHPHYSSSLHQHRQHHHHASHPYHSQQNQYAYHESPPFAHTSPYNGARRSISNSGRAAGMGYHGTSQHHAQTHPYHASPSQQFQETPNRKQSLASVHSEGSPVMYNRSLPGGGPPLSKAAQIARYYREQQQQQRQQSAWLSQPPTGSSPQHKQYNQHHYSSQSQNYHDTRPHAPMLMRAVSDEPESWPAHYGFGTDGSQTETPSTVEQFSIYRPDSGVLPDQNDPYYKQFSSQKSLHSSNLHQHEESVEGSRSGSSVRDGQTGEATGGELPMADRRGSTGSVKATLVYRPDKTELEHYDNLYRGITETHLRVKATRTMSMRSRSPTRQSISPEFSYTRALRQQQQQQLLDHKIGYGQLDSMVQQQQEQQQRGYSRNGGDGDDQDLPQVAYIQPSPPVLNQHQASPSSSSMATQDNRPRLAHYASIFGLHLQQQQQQQQQQPPQLHNRFHSSSSVHSAYTTTSPSSASSVPLTVRASFDHLSGNHTHTTSAHPLTRDFIGKEELFSQHGFPVVVPHTPLPLDRQSTKSSLGSEPETVIRIEDVLHDLTASLYYPKNGRSNSPLPPPPSTMPPPSPVPVSSPVGATRTHPRTETPSVRTRTPVNAAPPPRPPTQPSQPRMSLDRISRASFVSGRDLYFRSPPPPAGVDDNVKVEVFEDCSRNIKVEVRDVVEEEIEIKNENRSLTITAPTPTPAPAPAPVQESDVANVVSTPPPSGAIVTAVAECAEGPMAQLNADDDGNGDGGYEHDRAEWKEDEQKPTKVAPPAMAPTSTAGLPDRPPSLPSCPPPNFHPQVAESHLQSPQLQQQQLRWSAIKQSRLSSESRRDQITGTSNKAYQDPPRFVDSPEPEAESEDEEESEKVMYLRTTSASTISAPFVQNNHHQYQLHTRTGSPIPPRPTTSPHPLPSLSPMPTSGSISTTNLASTLRKGMIGGSTGRSSGEYAQSRASVDQVRTSVERATASASASSRVESKLRMSTDRTRGL